MRHFVLTRAAYGSAWSTEENERRLELMCAVTLPTLVAQTERRWEWVLLLDLADPLMDARAAAAEKVGVPVRFLHWDSSGETEKPRSRSAAHAYRASWRAALGPGEGPTLTTRLDDDDGLAPDALKRVRAAAEAYADPDPVVLELPVGYRVSEGCAELTRRERNAWITYRAPAGDSTLVYDFNHRRHELPVLHVDQEPGWLWLRHQDTLSGHKGRPANPIDERLRDLFPIDWAKVEAVPAGV